MKDFSVLMALVDFIPVAFFAVAAVILQRDLYNKMSKGAFALFAAGTIDVICAGALKALYKLLYAVGLCDFEPLSQMFFPVQSIGFLLAGLGILAMLLHRQGNTLLAVAPPVFSGTFIFVSLMVAGLGCMDGALIYMAGKLKKRGLWVLFLVSFLCCLSMGYLSSKDFDSASMNWIAEGINVLGQGMLLLGTLALRKAGLKELELGKDK